MVSTSTSLNQLEIGRPKTPANQSIDILWPLCDRYHICCHVCETMTGTSDGLSALLSDSGYEHLNWYEMQETKSLGCQLCTWICSFTDKSQLVHNSDGSITHEKIRAFAEVTRVPSSVETEHSTHPMKKMQLCKIRVKVPFNRTSALYRDGHDGEIFNVIALGSKLES
jgi:hypothetical protein